MSVPLILPMPSPSRGSGFGATGSVAIPTDGPEAWYRPATQAHWTALQALYPEVFVPDVLFGCQDASGGATPTIDLLGTGTWSELGGGGNLYQQAISGWATAALGAAESAGTGVGFLAPNNSALDLATDESYAVLAYMALTNPSTTRRFHQIQGNNNYQHIGTNGALLTRHGGVQGTASEPTDETINEMRQIMWQRRGDLSTNGGATARFPLIHGTYDGAAHAGSSRAMGSPTTSIENPQYRYNLYAIWKGTKANFDMRSLLSILRRVPGIPHYQDIGAAVNSTTSASPLNPPHITNDILFCVAETSDTATLSLSTPGNFNLVSGFPVTAGSGGAGSRLYVWWCRAASSSETSPVVDTSTNHVVARIISFRGCRTSGDPWDTVQTDSENTSTTAVAIPGASPSVASTLIFGIGTTAFDASTPQHSGVTNADLLQNRIAGQANTISGHGGGFALFLGERRAATAFGTTTSTLANASVQARACFALRS